MRNKVQLSSGLVETMGELGEWDKFGIGSTLSFCSPFCLMQVG